MTNEEIGALNLSMAVLCGYPVADEETASEPPQPYILKWSDDLLVVSEVAFPPARWSPVTNVAQALEVAEALRLQGWASQITLYCSGANTCEVRWKGEGPPPGGCLAHTRNGGVLAEAICLAVAATLEAKG